MRKMSPEAIYIRDQLKFAKEGADNLAKRHGYRWSRWLKGRAGQCTASFEREGENWSLSFYWTPAEELGALAKNIEQMDHFMRVAMKEFGALKLGALTAQAIQSQRGEVMQ